MAAAAVVPLAQGRPGSSVRPVVLTGALADEAARPLAQACVTTTYCFGETAADGRFRFDLRLPVPTRPAIKTLEEVETAPRRAAALAPMLGRRPAAAGRRRADGRRGTTPPAR